MEYPALCVSPICKRLDRHDEPGLTSGRAMLCQPCIDRARSDLYAIADLWEEVEANLATSSAPPEDEEGTSGRIGNDETGIKINEAASTARSLSVSIVWYMARALVSERNANPPEPSTTPSLAQWIGAWWLDHFTGSHHPQEAAEVARELRQAAKKMRTAAYPLGARKVETGLACPENAALPNPAGETVRCDGHMVAWVWKGMDRSPNLVCDTDPAHTIEPEVWQRQNWKRRLAQGMDSRQATRLARLIAG